MRVNVFVAHAAWDPPRKGTLARLRDSLGEGSCRVFESQEREHSRVWARRLWVAATEANPADVCVMLNDDVVAHPRLREHVATISALLPDEVISLHSQFPGTRAAADAGHRLVRCYWPSGPAIVMRPGHARELLAWLDSTPREWFDGTTNEDGAIASWLWSRQTPAYATIPALVRHDVAVGSTLGYDAHPHRVSLVDWADFAPGEWTQKHVDTAPYVPVPWFDDHSLRVLGDALRGITPLCGMCWQMPASLANDKRKTGVCWSCAQGIAQTVMTQMLGKQGVVKS